MAFNNKSLYQLELWELGYATAGDGVCEVGQGPLDAVSGSSRPSLGWISSHDEIQLGNGGSSRPAGYLLVLVVSVLLMCWTSKVLALLLRDYVKSSTTTAYPRMIKRFRHKMVASTVSHMIWSLLTPDIVPSVEVTLRRPVHLAAGLIAESKDKMINFRRILHATSIRQVVNRLVKHPSPNIVNVYGAHTTMTRIGLHRVGSTFSPALVSILQGSSDIVGRNLAALCSTVQHLVRHSNNALAYAGYSTTTYLRSVIAFIATSFIGSSILPGFALLSNVRTSSSCALHVLGQHLKQLVSTTSMYRSATQLIDQTNVSLNVALVQSLGHAHRLIGLLSVSLNAVKSRFSSCAYTSMDLTRRVLSGIYCACIDAALAGILATCPIAKGIVRTITYGLSPIWLGTISGLMLGDILGSGLRLMLAYISVLSASAHFALHNLRSKYVQLRGSGGIPGWLVPCSSWIGSGPRRPSTQEQGHHNGNGAVYSSSSGSDEDLSDSEYDDSDIETITTLNFAQRSQALIDLNSSLFDRFPLAVVSAGPTTAGSTEDVDTTYTFKSLTLLNAVQDTIHRAAPAPKHDSTTLAAKLETAQRSAAEAEERCIDQEQIDVTLNVQLNKDQDTLLRLVEQNKAAAAGKAQPDAEMANLEAEIEALHAKPTSVHSYHDNERLGYESTIADLGLNVIRAKHEAEQYHSCGFRALATEQTATPSGPSLQLTNIASDLRDIETAVTTQQSRLEPSTSSTVRSSAVEEDRLDRTFPKERQYEMDDLASTGDRACFPLGMSDVGSESGCSASTCVDDGKAGPVEIWDPGVDPGGTMSSFEEWDTLLEDAGLIPKAQSAWEDIWETDDDGNVVEKEDATESFDIDSPQLLEARAEIVELENRLEEQGSRLKLCQAALSSAAEERRQYKLARDALQASHKVNDAVEDGQVAQIAQLKALVADGESRLRLCRAALQIASEERRNYKLAREALKMSQKVDGTVEDNLVAENAMLRSMLEDQGSRFKLCQAALRSANDDRRHFKLSWETLKMSHKVDAAVEDGLVAENATLRSMLEDQGSRLKLCQVALRSANDDRRQFKLSWDTLRLSGKVDGALEDTLVSEIKTLTERLVSLERSRFNLNEQLDALHGSMDFLRAEAHFASLAQRDQIESLGSHLDAAETRERELGLEVVRLQEQIEFRIQSKQRVDGELDDIKSELQKLQEAREEQLEDIRDELASARGDIRLLKRRLWIAKDEAAEAQVNLDAVRIKADADRAQMEEWLVVARDTIIDQQQQIQDLLESSSGSASSCVDGRPGDSSLASFAESGTSMDTGLAHQSTECAQEDVFSRTPSESSIVDEAGPLRSVDSVPDEIVDASGSQLKASHFSLGQQENRPFARPRKPQRRK
ncbi:hypothetical protein WOLCODRAFT_163820 [Wolfiporia cocos MD-104 SS10]|uniref:Uncharacterized protein n=1 Tax=Wolfiporia cocos (strain MD-104) TaxID=742152 RepID=A0A2H3K258_WOLCO|nr:hypothetical protein WOLCODRAFT_163820 [Wolfiporia cocos MD-104 SS10]